MHCLREKYVSAYHDIGTIGRVGIITYNAKSAYYTVMFKNR